MKTKPVNLYTLKKSKQYIRPLRNKILELLGDSVFECTTKQDFAYEALKLMYPVNRGLENNINSINKACTKLFSILTIGKAVVSVFEVGGKPKEITPKKEERESIQIFLETYLQFETSPGVTLKVLESLVREDMVEIYNLINWYESTPFIKEHLDKGAQPQNHEERIWFDFYYRCIKEQKIITEYYLNGLKKRALTKANYWGATIKSLISYSERFRDRPYHFAGYFAYPYYDCRKIDLIANKVSEFAFDESGKLEKLYMHNRTKFYRLLFKRHTALGVFQELHFYLSYLPLANNRKPIFSELETLFKRKSWIGYYSLALTQIEGLFSEMYAVLNPNGTSGRKSLPDKVQYARPFHEMSDTYFDYYQYHIPRLRNKFMHSGYDEDFKLKSFDLLFDLRYLLKIFYELDNPLVKIKQLHTRRKFEEFITYAEFANYFELLNKLSKKQKDDIAFDIKAFEVDFLIAYCNAEYICLEIAEGLPKDMAKFIEDAGKRLSVKSKPFSYLEKNYLKIESQINADKELAEIVSDCYSFNRHESDALVSYQIFLSNYKKYLSALNKDYLKILDNLDKEYRLPLLNISRIKELISNNE